MEFEKVLEVIIKNFEEEGVRYALIGGFALGVLGVPRATVDLDFLVLKEDLPKVDKIMQRNNYECKYRTENVSQYVSPLKIFGEVDFLHAFRKTSSRMLEDAIEKDIFEGRMKIKVLRPEDIIGLKIQAAVNDSERAEREFLDIEALMNHYKERLDWDLIEEYFSLFEQEDKFKELKSKYAKIK